MISLIKVPQRGAEELHYKPNNKHLFYGAETKINI
jgi:hypothetical protein